MSELSASNEVRHSPKTARAELREQLRLAEEGRQLMTESKNFHHLLEYVAKSKPGPKAHISDKGVYRRTVKKARQTQQRLYEQSAAIYSQLDEREPIFAPEGHIIAVEFPSIGDGSIKTSGVDVRLDSPDGPVYVDTGVRWWSQSGILAPLPDGMLTRNNHGEYAFVADSLELAGSDEFKYHGPTFYAYNYDRSMRVLHGIGWTTVSIRPDDWVSQNYPYPSEPVPENAWAGLQASQIHRQDSARAAGRVALF